MNAFPETLSEAIKYFADEENAHSFLCALRWPDGHPQCCHCDSKNCGKMVVTRRRLPASKLKPARVLTRRLWNCKNCGKQFSAIKGSIFEASPLGLDKWFTAAWLLLNCKNGVSSYEIARSIGVTQKTAWFMGHRLRFLTHNENMDKLAGELEADECHFGPSAKWMHKNQRDAYAAAGYPKMPVLAVLERGVRTGVAKGLFGKPEKTPSRIRVAVSSPGNVTADVPAFILQNAAKGSVLNTDEHVAYDVLGAEYIHRVVNHTVEYVRGTVSVNGTENFWTLLRRSLRGTYVCPSVRHLWRYVDTQAARFNTREENCFDRFSGTVKEAPGRRLTWKRLTGKDATLVSSEPETFSL